MMFVLLVFACVRQENLFGDCLVSAAFMSYAGPFGAAYRNELVIDEWMASVKEKARAGAAAAQPQHMHATCHVKLSLPTTNNLLKFRSFKRF